MRKLFRMKYESCSGRCYAYSDVMRIHTLGLTTKTAAAFLARLVDIHEPSCGNDQIQFRLDADEFTTFDDLKCNMNETEVQRTRFVASFYHYGSLDLFGGDSPLEALDKMIDAALAYYASAQYRADSKSHEGLGHDVCEHGTDKKLVEFAISFSGLNATEQDLLRAEFAQ